MAEESTAQAVTEVSKPTEEPARAEEPIPIPAVAEVQPAEGGVVATEGVDEAPKSEEAAEEPAAKEGLTANEPPKTESVGADADTSNAADISATNGTPAAKKGNNGKRKSTGATDSKKKTTAKGKKKAPELHLDVKSGEMHMVAMRGYQPWPVIVCDEAMLPESLLSKRPVSARRIDGSYREDFADGGKNAKDRRYPIMFLGTNEFAWQVNTELLPFNLQEVKDDVATGKQGKKNKALWEAYQTAAEGHDLDYFKQLLANHEEAMQQDLDQKLLKEQEKKEKTEKASKRKSTAAADSEDVDMEDAGEGAPKNAKGSKKRKKGDESDGENEKPAKTPKAKLKLTNKTPKDASTAKPKKETKSKKKGSEEAESAPVEEPPLTEEERLQKREKQILYLRHRLQKGFLSRDQAPKDEDMSSMSDYLNNLEQHPDLEAEIIKKTKVHKVLKAIIKLNEVPKEEEFKFKDRSSALLTKWSGALASENDGAATTPAAVEPVANGVKHDDEQTESAKDESPAEKKEETPAVATDAKPTDTDGDVTMTDAEKPAEKSVDAIKAELAASAGGATEGTNGVDVAAALTETTTTS